MFLLDWAIIFLILALVAGVLGFSGIARESSGIAKVLFIVFLVIYIASFFFRSDHKVIQLQSPIKLVHETTHLPRFFWVDWFAKEFGHMI